MSPDVIVPKDRNFEKQPLLVGFYPKPGRLDIAILIKATFRDKKYHILFLYKFAVGH